MTEKDKMMAFHVMQSIKELPPDTQNFNLIALCHVDKSGRMEQFARILADHEMPTKQIVPCIMDLFQTVLLDREGDLK